jgi:hypothetical protein
MREAAKRFYTALWWLCLAAWPLVVVTVACAATFAPEGQHLLVFGAVLLALSVFLFMLPLLLVIHWIASGRWDWGWRW